MAWLIGITSSDGVLIAGTGQTQAEAVDSLADEYGDNVMLLLSEAESQIRAKIAARLAYEQARRELAPHLGPVDLSALGVSRGQIGGRPAAADDQAEASTGEVQHGGTEADADTEERSEVGASEDDQSEEAETEEEAEEGGETVCAVCGDDVTTDWAEVSLEDYGEVRCRGCSV